MVVQKYYVNGRQSKKKINLANIRYTCLKASRDVIGHVKKEFSFTFYTEFFSTNKDILYPSKETSSN